MREGEESETLEEGEGGNCSLNIIYDRRIEINKKEKNHQKKMLNLSKMVSGLKVFIRLSMGDLIHST